MDVRNCPTLYPIFPTFPFTIQETFKQTTHLKDLPSPESLKLTKNPITFHMCCTSVSQYIYNNICFVHQTYV